MDMIGSVKITNARDIEIVSQFAGCPPCQILSLNGVRRAEDLLGREVMIKVSIYNLVRKVDPRYSIKNGRIISKA